MNDGNTLAVKRIARKHGNRWKWVKEDTSLYAKTDIWEKNYRFPHNWRLARNQPGALSLFLKETTIPMARALLATIDSLGRVRYDDRDKEWHESYEGALRFFRDLHEAGRRFYNEGRI